ncbi:MAG: PAS domain S-box protein [Gammaproteobacteria bacterium]|nr:PAS domain S-box protein [Gammaproteobacteria bacterium]
MSGKSRMDQVQGGQDSGFHRNILENLSDGVITVGFDGRIQDFNSAASRMFGLRQDDVLGKTLAEAFIAVEGFDEFSETILGAIASQTGPKRKVVNVQTADQQRLLTITTSRLTVSNQEGTQKTVGVIAVFSDITEIKELREAEIQMARTVEKKHVELQSAYRKIEESRDELKWILKKVAVARIGATILIIVLFLGVGAWTWSTSDSGDWSEDTALAGGLEPGSSEAVRTVVVTPREFQSEVSLKGLLQPWRLVKVASPVDGRLEKIHFRYGQNVTRGERLIDLDTEELLFKLQESQIEYENAYKTIQEMEDWENSAEMSAELRSFSKTKMELDSAESDLKTSEFLVQKGLIPTSQHEDQKQRYQRQLLDFEAARQSLASTRARGQGHQKKVAQLEFEKAQKKLRLLEEDLLAESVSAPIAGAILPLELNMDGLAEGQAVVKGEVLLTIADSEKLTAVTSVDEVNVTKVRAGQPVSIRGDAFSDFMLRGTVSHVSPQSRQNVKGGAPRFEVTVELEPLEGMKRSHLRAGMSCQVRIVVHHNPQALMVPVEAIDTRGDQFLVHILDPDTGAARVQEVQIGLTSLEAVEVLSGIAHGDRVILPAE